MAAFRRNLSRFQLPRTGVCVQGSKLPSTGAMKWSLTQPCSLKAPRVCSFLNAGSVVQCTHSAFGTKRLMSSQPSRVPPSNQIKKVLSQIKHAEELSQFIILHLDRLDCSAVSTAFYKMAGLSAKISNPTSFGTGGAAPEMVRVAIDQLSLRAMSCIEQYELPAPDLARTLWALGQMGPGLWPQTVAQLLEALIHRVEASAHSFAPRELVEIFQALRDMPWLAEERALRALFKQGSNIAKDFSPALIAALLPTMHSLKVTEKNKMLQDICRHAAAVAPTFSPYLIAMTLRPLANIKSRSGMPAKETDEVQAAKVKAPMDVLVEGLCHRASSAITLFDPREVSSTLRSLADLGVPREALPVVVMTKRLARGNDEFEPEAIADALVGLASLKTGGGGGGGGGGAGDGGDRDKAMQAMLQQAVAKAHQFEPKHIAGGRQGQSDAAMLQQAVAKAHQFEPKHIADTLLALGAIGVGAQGAVLVERLLARIEECAGSFEAPHIASALGSLSQLGVAVSDSALSGLCARAERVRGAFEADEVTEVLWALQQLQVAPAPGLVRGMCQQATAKAMAFDASGVGEVLGVLAHLDEGDGSVDKATVHALSLRAAVLSEQLETSHLVNVLASLLVLSELLPAEASIVKALSCRVGDKLGEVSDAQLVVVLRALAALCGHAKVSVDEEVLDGLADRVRKTVSELDPEDTAHVLSAFADLGVTDKSNKIASQLVERAIELRGRMNGLDLSKTIAAVERLCIDVDPALLEAYKDLLQAAGDGDDTPSTTPRNFMQ
eukprot:CAMPEP_0196757998 /NCGR_PEP_ID=MMETSP1091-20130531/103950_1 /TAXON_ID=302021 /ORGANISM="Rhodomonas sp., Strain CCMP768" /LENGTH=780 /DNA_ID=CAMNT_0042106795 /DNA_START=14 /DNA_END=2357 /DNA_ORIENTATION=+